MKKVYVFDKKKYLVKAIFKKSLIYSDNIPS